jgi:hypothetical protein
MRMIRVVAVGLTVVLALAGCRKILNNDEAKMNTRMVNLIVDSPAVQYKIDDTIIASVSYQAATALAAARPGSHPVSFGALRPTSLVSTDSAEPIVLTGSFTRDYAKDTDYTIVAYGTLDTLQTLVLEDPSKKDDLADDTMELKFVNTAPNVGSVDVYITAPEGGITVPESLGTIALGAKTPVRSMKLTKRPDVTDSTAAVFTDATIEVRQSGTGTVLYTSTKIRFTEQTRYTLAVSQNAGPGPAPVQLIGLDGAGVSGTFTAPADQAAVRVVNLSPDTGPIDVIRASSTNIQIAQNLAFRGRSDYVKVANGDVDLIAQPSGGQAAVFLFLEEITANPGASYSAYAVGPLASVDAQVLVDDRRKVPTQAKYRFLNAAPSQIGGDGVDIYVTVPGLVLDFDSTDDKDTTDDAAQFRRAAALVFHGLTDSSVYKAATYQVRVMATGTSRVLLDTTVPLVNGTVQTFALIDSEAGQLELMTVDEAI